MDFILRQLQKTFRSPWFPWAIVGMLLLAVVAIEIVQLPWVESLSGFGHVLFWVFVLLGIGFFYLVFTRFNELYEQRERLAKRLDESESEVSSAYQRLETVFQVSQKFVEASNENDVIEPVLRLLADLSGADGVSFVPLDEHGQPLAAISHGDLPFPVMEAWVEYLASPGVRDRCRSCTTPEILDKPASCPLLKAPLAGVTRLLCLPVRRGEREFGIVTLFLSAEAQIDPRTNSYLHALIDAAALGLEGVHLRRRELDALRQMQFLRQKTDLKVLLTSLLENILRTIEADFAAMIVPAKGQSKARFDLTLGEFPAPARLFLDGIVQGVVASGEPVLLGDVSGDPSSATELRSLIAVPLLSSMVESSGKRAVLGVILVGNRRMRSLHQRQLVLLQTIAGQVALVVQNADLVAELEYKIMIQERTRLAREIHDGLAQTLGFLKLQAAQMRNYLGKGDVERVRQNIDRYYTTLAEAYQDARQAIDGLRISPAECGLIGWLEQTANDFQEVSGLQVTLRVAELQSELPPEVHAQLIRIVQEALSNVRKHSRAGRVWLTYLEREGELVLEIRDDGEGFEPDDIAMPSRHGLRGMRERADLIEGEFQVISHPGQGTIVKISLPVRAPAATAVTGQASAGEEVS